MEPEIVQGPIADHGGLAPMYQVTLEQGIVLTNPAGFGDRAAHAEDGERAVVVAEDGTLLTGRAGL